MSRLRLPVGDRNVDLSRLVCVGLLRSTGGRGESYNLRHHEEGETSKILIIAGLIMTLVVTLPLMLLLILFMIACVDRDRRERPDADPPAKDEWRLM